jgi:hypothetical protein
MGGHHEEHSSGVFNIAIATIFAREFLEGAIIIGQYRTVINKSDWDAERKQQGLKTVTMSAAAAIAVAIAVVLAVAIPLGILGAGRCHLYYSTIPQDSRMAGHLLEGIHLSMEEQEGWSQEAG